MRLYRGDRFPLPILSTRGRHRGRTFADHFCGNGLMAKFADGGISRLLERKDLVDLVLAHVGYDVGRPEQELADHSPLISFSEDKRTAFGFVDRTHSLDLEECLFDDATHFMWQIEIALPSPRQPGLYEITYEADPVNCMALVEQQLTRGVSREVNSGNFDSIAKSLMNAVAMAHAAEDQRMHYARLIDVLTYVNSQDVSGREARLVNNTLQRADRDREWLLYPNDLMPDGHGFSARFTMNRHLAVHSCYRVRSMP